MAGVELTQMLAGPGVGGMVVHVDLFPDAPAQEGYRVRMPGGAAGDGHLAVRIDPFIRRDKGIARAVVHLPVFEGFRRIIELELLGEVAVHRPDDEGLPLGHHRIGAQEGLLLRIGMRRGKVIVLADDADGGIDAVARLHDLRGQLGAVAVTDHIRAPFLRQLQCQLLISGLTGEGEAALTVLLIHLYTPPCSCIQKSPYL